MSSASPLRFSELTSRSAHTLKLGLDREAMSYVATTAGITGEDVRDLMVAAVEHRFGPVNQLPSPIEWLTDNGSCYLARDTRRFARNLGLVPKTTPLESPQSNGMAEAFVRTLKRDYVRVSVLPDAESVLRQLPGWLAHYNDLHPHRAIKPGDPVRSLRGNISASSFPSRPSSFGSEPYFRADHSDGG
ncbi:DDE-type integrase/transposase/recombinase [Methylobacterium terricola]|uniref:DDE-type integrase/transposase/recombinase n=1 Tax=Methylobacterium terricola TaxID=2583531 RepID=A0A5C4L8A1_9HYPH|nr:DDE-type integrase/transposase/recombinase [Methylobacterium terricola]